MKFFYIQEKDIKIEGSSKILFSPMARRTAVLYKQCRFCKTKYIYPNFQGAKNKRSFVLKNKLNKTAYFCSWNCKEHIIFIKGVKYKKCPSCYQILDLEKNFWIEKKHDRYNHYYERCRACYRGKGNPKKQERYLKYGRDWKKRNKAKVKEYKSKIIKNEVKNLHDYYIRRLLARYSTLTESEIPKELIELKRLQIILIREIRNRREAEK